MFEIFGLSNLWVIGAYAGCIISVIICIYASIRAGRSSDEEGDSDE